MGKNKSAQLDLFGLFKEDAAIPSSSSTLNGILGKPPDLQFNLFRKPVNESKDVALSAANQNSESSTLRFLSHRISPSNWGTSFPDNITRSNLYIETINSLSAFKVEVKNLIQKTKDNPSPELAGQWETLIGPQEVMYSRYSGEGGLPISHRLVEAHLTFLKSTYPPAEQRNLLLAGLQAYLNGSFPNVVSSELLEIKILLKGFGSGELSTTRIEMFLELLGKLDQKTYLHSNREMSKTLTSIEGNGAYYSPELFQELLRLIPLTSLHNQEINVLEPNVGKGSLIRPLVHHPGMLIYANDLNPISAEITELTTMVNPSTMAAACEKGAPVSIKSNCIVTRKHAFDLCKEVPDGVFDLLIANPPYISVQANKETKKKLKAFGLKAKKEEFSLTEFTRKALPMKLREGGISMMITSTRANNFKRTIHSNGLVSHPIFILALSGQPFSMNQANLMPISMVAYPFFEGKIGEKKQIKAECFISINAVAPTSVINRKNSAFTECEIIHLALNDLPAFTKHCLNQNQWSDLDQRVVGVSMQMLQSANLLRIFTILKKGIQDILGTEIQTAKRRYETEKGKGLKKQLDEMTRKRFHQIGSFEDILSWIETVEKKSAFPIQSSIVNVLKKNPLRQYRSQRENKTVSKEIRKILSRTFRSILSVRNRFFGRTYLLSEIYPIRANITIATMYGPYNGSCFTTDHSILGRLPYPFSLYALNEPEIAQIINAFPVIEQKEVLSRLWEKAFTLNHNVKPFNHISREAEQMCLTLLGEAWYRNLSMGVLPEVRFIKHLSSQNNEICQGIGKILLPIAQQNSQERGAMNQAMDEMKLIEKQRAYNTYLRKLSSESITPIKRENLLKKTTKHLSELHCGINILEGSTRPIRKIRRLIPVN